MTLKIAIIGGSITGCTAAVELSRHGCDVVLFERSGEELKDRGAGIGVPPSVMETFVARDLVDAALPFFPARCFVRRWRTDTEPAFGHLAWEQPTSLALLNWGALYRNLRARVPASVYRTHRRAIALSAERGEVTLADGSRETFDLVVAADGYASLGRRTLFPDIEIAYAGYVLWRGCLPESALAESTALETGIHALGYADGHGVFYLVPGAAGGTSRGERLVNWGMYLPVSPAALNGFMTDATGQVHTGSLPPGAMPPDTEERLKTGARARLPAYYADIVAASHATFVYAIYDCEVPAYRRGRLCLAGDAGAFARPHSGAGALKGMQDAIALREALTSAADLETALAGWDRAQTAHGNHLVRFGNQLGRALVREIPDWSRMSTGEMASWFASAVTIDTEMFGSAARG